jgi:hypothetical protein
VNLDIKLKKAIILVPATLLLVYVTDQSVIFIVHKWFAVFHFKGINSKWSRYAQGIAKGSYMDYLVTAKNSCVQSMFWKRNILSYHIEALSDVGQIWQSGKSTSKWPALDMRYDFAFCFFCHLCSATGCCILILDREAKVLKCWNFVLG